MCIRDRVIDVFGSGGGSALAEEMDIPFLGKIPLDPQVREAGDKGVPTVVSSPDSRTGEALSSLMHAVDERLAVLDSQ